MGVYNIKVWKHMDLSLQITYWKKFHKMHLYFSRYSLIVINKYIVIKTITLYNIFLEIIAVKLTNDYKFDKFAV